MRPRCHLGKSAGLCFPSHSRTQYLDHPSSSSVWMEPRYKEVATHCALLQEHAQRCYVRGEQECPTRKECGSEGGTKGSQGWGPEGQ